MNHALLQFLKLVQIVAIWTSFFSSAFAAEPSVLQVRFSQALIAGAYPLHLDLFVSEPRQISNVALAFTVDLPSVENDQLRRAEVSGGGQRLRFFLGEYNFATAPEQVWLDLDIELANGRRLTPERLVFNNTPLDLTYAQPTLRLEPNGLTARLLLKENTIAGGSVAVAAAAPSTTPGGTTFFSRREPLWLDQGRFEHTFARADLPARIHDGSRWLISVDIDDMWGRRYTLKQLYDNAQIDSLALPYLEIQPTNMIFTLKGESIRIKRYNHYQIAGRQLFEGDHDGFEYASDNSDIVYIDRFGRAVAVAPGTTTITVKQPGQTTRIPAKVLY